MKIVLKFQNEVKEYSSVSEATKFLNEAWYYCDRLELSASFSELVDYTKVTSLSGLMRDAKIYGEGWINVYQIFE